MIEIWAIIAGLFFAGNCWWGARTLSALAAARQELAELAEAIKGSRKSSTDAAKLASDASHAAVNAAKSCIAAADMCWRIAEHGVEKSPGPVPEPSPRPVSKRFAKLDMDEPKAGDR